VKAETLMRMQECYELAKAREPESALQSRDWSRLNLSGASDVQ